MMHQLLALLTVGQTWQLGCLVCLPAGVFMLACLSQCLWLANFKAHAGMSCRVVWLKSLLHKVNHDQYLHQLFS